MKRAAVLLAVVACGCAPVRPKAPSGPVLLVHAAPAHTTARAWVVGVAQVVGEQAVIALDGHHYVGMANGEWDPEQFGDPVIIEGTLVREDQPSYSLPNGDATSCVTSKLEVDGKAPAPLSARADDGLLAAERALFAAIAAKDGKALEQLLADDFVGHTWGKQETSRKQFLEGIAALPVIRGIDGEDLVAYRAGDVGAVAGIQVARVEVNGAVVEDRSRFIDIFARRGNSWILIVAVTVASEPVDPGSITLTGGCRI